MKLITKKSLFKIVKNIPVLNVAFSKSVLLLIKKWVYFLRIKAFILLIGHGLKKSTITNRSQKLQFLIKMGATLIFIATISQKKLN